MNNNNAVLSSPVEYEVNGQEVKLTGNIVKQYLVSGNGAVTDQEVVMFLNLCKFQKLNPFLNEAYLVKFGSKPAQIIVSKEAFMKRAEAHPQYNGFTAGVIVEREGEIVELEGAIKLDNDKLIGGWAEIYRADRKVPVMVKLSYKEFSKGQAAWSSMPMNMIRKTAIVNAMREAFPDSLGALYTEEEELPSSPRSVEVEVEETIRENANKEVIDFNDTADDAVIVDEPVDVEVEERKEVDTADNQGALFKNLTDLENEAPSF